MPSRRRYRLAFLMIGGVSALLSGRGAAFTPESPEVKQSIERGLKWLENEDDPRLGGQCLIGLSFVKAGRPLSHAKIVAARAACETLANTELQSLDNYSAGLALVFLLETDPERNRSLAQRYVRELLRRQQPGGGWSYQGYETGDTSQTQYPLLGLWLAINNGLDVPAGAIDRACGWLVRTQDPSGGWGYQGRDPGGYGRRVTQSDVKPALAAAGLGSMYICADIIAPIESKSKENTKGLPSALKPVGDPLATKLPAASSSIDGRFIRQAISDGNHWFSRNFGMESEGHTHYYLYAFERCQSFRELAERSSDSSPRWYNDIVAYLRRTQAMDGSWPGSDGPAIETSFAVLTLLRSAKKTIAHVAGSSAKAVGEGVLLGGMGLPKNTADLQERDGRIVQSPLAGTIDELMATIERGNTAELELLADSPTRWKLDSNVTKRTSDIARLRAVVASGSFESRFLAVRALGRVRELDNVPLLIYALSDPDMRVVREADKGLRFISRKFEGVGIPEEPKPQDAKSGAAAWKAWYLSIRPSAEFLD
jgi:prenyltransferase/squalene oxidase-like repeat protein